MDPTPKRVKVKKYKSTKLKVKALKNLCKSLGLPTDGTKKDLLNRINNFSVPENENQFTETSELDSYNTPEIQTDLNNYVDYLNPSSYDFEEQNNQEQNTEEQNIYKSILQEQDKEYNESLQADILKDKIKQQQQNIQQEIQHENQQKIKEDIQQIQDKEQDIILTKNDLRNARLKYFNI